MTRTRQLVSIGLVSFAVGTLIVSWAIAQEKPEKDKDSKKAAQAAAEADWMALSAPGEGHKRLEQFVGEWDTRMKIWAAGPSAPPSESTGSSKTRWALGKRFLMDEYKGEMSFPDASGKMVSMPFEGMGMTGYDNFRNVYVGTWADSMGTQLLTMTGSSDAEGKVFTYHGVMDEPGLKVIGRLVRYETRVLDADRHVFSIHDVHAIPEQKVMEITYTRKKR